MAHEIAKIILEHSMTYSGADKVLKRAEAIRSALALGMPLNEIEDYLDWLDAINNVRRPGPNDRASSGED
jgi:DNA-binding transcriptional MerR regulator